MLDRLKHTFTQLASGGLCVAFSGGADSALVLTLAAQTGGNVHAVTFESELHPQFETEAAIRFAQKLDIPHTILTMQPLEIEEVRQNRRDRCYHCKKAMFSRLCEYARERHLQTVIDGTNVDDLLETRPGLRALGELGVMSPLAVLGLGKQQVRDCAQALGLSCANKPSSPCLATRLPYDTKITPGHLRKIAEGERFLREQGFGEVRLRMHVHLGGELARVEIPKNRFADFLVQADFLGNTLRNVGFSFVTLDIEGLRSGSYDEKNKKTMQREVRNGD